MSSSDDENHAHASVPNTEQKLTPATARLETVGLLAGGVVHDFNNLLSTITGFTALALRQIEPKQDDKLAAYLDEVHRAGLRGQDLVEQLVVMLRGQATAGHVMSLEPMLKEIARYQRDSLADTIEFRYEAATALVDVVIDPVALYEVMRCVFAHACDVMPARGSLTLCSRVAEALSSPCAVCAGTPQGLYVRIEISYSAADADAVAVAVGIDGGVEHEPRSAVSRLHALGVHVQIDSPSAQTTRVSLLIPSAA